VICDLSNSNVQNVAANASTSHYDLGFCECEIGRLDSVDNPFAAKVLPVSPEQNVTDVSRMDQQ
jgi:hypothetical protein